MIVGLILAGGLSSRMGEDKALLRVGNETMLQRTARVLREAGADFVAMSGSRTGGIPDRWRHAGPVGGIASAVEVLPDAEKPDLVTGLARELTATQGLLNAR